MTLPDTERPDPTERDSDKAADEALAISQHVEECRADFASLTEQAAQVAAALAALGPYHPDERQTFIADARRELTALAKTVSEHIGWCEEQIAKHEVKRGSMEIRKPCPWCEELGCDDTCRLCDCCGEPTGDRAREYCGICDETASRQDKEDEAVDRAIDERKEREMGHR